MTSKKTKNSAKVSKLSNLKQHLKKRKKLIVITGIILVVALIIALGVISQNKKEQLVKRNEEIQKIQEQSSDESGQLLGIMDSDIVLGDENAPVTIIEYASLSCPHCANFHSKVFSKIEEDFVKSGKVKYVYRDFPLNQPALLGTIISLCHARNNNNNSDKYYKFLKVLFKTQDSWAFDGNFFEKLRSLAKLDGMTSSEFDKCVNDKKLVDEILKRRLEASKQLTIDSTPSFIVNQKLIGGYRDFNKFKEIIENELNPSAK